MIKEERAAYNKAYRAKNPEKVKADIEAWKKAHPEKTKVHHAVGDSRERGYGFNMLNTYFPGSVPHHINDMDVVFIPKSIHTACSTGRNKERHRKLVLDYYDGLENMIGWGRQGFSGDSG